jgi:hypothetical protein
MSRVLRTGLTGLPLTSAAHRLLLLLNDPEMTMAASHTLTAAPDPAAVSCRCRGSLILPLTAAPDAMKNLSPPRGSMVGVAGDPGAHAPG